MNAKVDVYIKRSTLWPDELARIRPILMRCGLDEDLKWGKPCYSHEGNNIAILQEMKGFLAFMFFKGALLDDPEGVLESQGPNTRSAKRICFRSVDDVDRLSDVVTAYVDQAIEVERAVLEVEPAPETVFVEEIQDRLDRDPALHAAFAALTPGRQRKYNLFVSEAKQAKTREDRVEKHVDRILAGKGLRDR